ncbi:ABC-three component system middle component 8 [Moraxella sp. VT-16-12]|uniref:ABC-three component system middle component 8 n=1 Tax=Moraxella sp. VT-16-12 TaxID=2014877 RepID=UPI00351B1285
MLKTLKKEQVIKYNNLLNMIKDKITSGEYLFLPALNFLFLLGLVDYQSKNDTLVYTKK